MEFVEISGSCDETVTFIDIDTAHDSKLNIYMSCNSPQGTSPPINIKENILDDYESDSDDGLTDEEREDLYRKLFDQMKQIKHPLHALPDKNKQNSYENNSDNELNKDKEDFYRKLFDQGNQIGSKLFPDKFISFKSVGVNLLPFPKTNQNQQTPVFNGINEYIDPKKQLKETSFTSIDF